MSAIHQLFCTHCTHGSSALERSQGDLAARMLGYSVRAGSLEGDRLRQLYRQVERYLSYHLPHDTPGHAKLELTAESAPRRLVFIPSAGSLQIIALVSYRPRDSEGRPGSYFAHLLCRELRPGEPAWTAVDALRLWNASGWVVRDSAEHPFLLPALAACESLLGGEAPAIDDAVFLRFLQGAGGASDSWLPERWRRAPPRQRAALFERALGALIAAGTTRRQTVLVAVEPEVAALLFYGIARLIPEGDLRASISFSTFEPAADRLLTAVAATTFFDPQTAEFRTDSLRGRGIAINTYRDLDSQAAGEGCYAPGIVRRLLGEGWESVDRHLRMIAAAGPKRLETLEAFAVTEQTVAAWFDSPQAAAGGDWRKLPELRDFARRLVLQRLGDALDSGARFSDFAGRPSLAALVELAAEAPPGSGPDDAIDSLLDQLPEPQVEPLLRLPEVAEDWKARLLVRRIERAGRMPSGCEWIWDDDPPPGGPAAEKCRALGTRILQGISGTSTATLLASLQSPRFENAVDRLLDACALDPARWTVFAEIARGMSDAALIAVWRRCGSRCFAAGHDGGVLAGRVQTILRTLPEHPAEFPERFAFVAAGRELLQSAADQKRLAAWDACREAICDLAPAGEKVGGWGGPLVLHRLEAAARRMADSAAAAMPPSEFSDDARSTRKEHCLRTIGARLLAGQSLLPDSEWHNDALWKKVRWRFEMGRWPSIPLRKLAFGSADRSRIWIAAGVAAAVVLGVLAIIGLASFGTGAKSSEAIVLEPRAGRAAAPPQRGAPAATPLRPSPTAPDAKVEAKPASPPPAAADPFAADTPPPAVEAEPLIFEPAAAPRVSASSAGAGESPPAAAAGQAPGAPSGAETAAALTGATAPPAPLIPIDGRFAVEKSPARGLKPPAVASVRVVVKGVGGRVLPDRILKDFTIGALIIEIGGSHEPRYLELPDLSLKRDAEIFDGAEDIFVSFCFSRPAGDLAKAELQVVATSYARAQIPVETGSYYEVRFELARPAIDQLEALAQNRVSR